MYERRRVRRAECVHVCVASVVLSVLRGLYRRVAVVPVVCRHHCKLQGGVPQVLARAGQGVRRTALSVRYVLAGADQVACGQGEGGLLPVAGRRGAAEPLCQASPHHLGAVQGPLRNPALVVHCKRVLRPGIVRITSVLCLLSAVHDAPPCQTTGSIASSASSYKLSYRSNKAAVSHVSTPVRRRSESSSRAVPASASASATPNGAVVVPGTSVAALLTSPAVPGVVTVATALAPSTATPPSRRSAVRPSTTPTPSSPAALFSV